ncbi:MAG: bacitracin resistance protein BacA [Leptospira sp.]|nr:bacitracin resistance protein BacA [Leptospira sp.]
MERDIYTPPGGPPQGPPLSPELFKTIGESAIRDLVKSFYEEIEKSNIRPMFPESIEESIVKSADFMVQVMGGPSYYTRKNGPPRMRARHFPFEIDEKARRTWLGCYRKALDNSEIPESEKTVIWDFLTGFSAWMVNKV